MFPIFLDLRDRLAVVVGGGPVGRRKAKALRRAGARVRLVCLEPAPADSPTADWLAMPYRPEHLDGAALVIAAATPEVNRRIVSDARGRGLWVNSATEPSAGDFFLPATLNRGDLSLAIATSGKAPGLAREVRLLLEEEFDDAFLHWIALVGELRPHVIERFAEKEQRHIVLQKLCRREWLQRIRQDGPEQVRAEMLAVVEGAG